MLESFSLAGQVVILTGGAGAYGRGLTRQIAEAGAVVVIASRDLSALKKVAAEESAKGHRVEPERFDQGDESQSMQLRDRVLARFGRIDGLVNNAIHKPVRSLTSPLSAWDESMRVNAVGLFALTRAIGDIMAAQGGGSIVNIASILGMVGPTLANYEGTAMTTPPDYYFHKGGMINLTRYFASVYGCSGVRVNCVSPGGYLQDPKSDPSSHFQAMHPDFVERYKRCTMLGRMAQDGDLGGPVTFLLSAASAYVTGVNLPVDGGYTAK